MLYRILKIIVATGIRLYYREIRILNGRNLDYGGPLILIANHPNTLMDAWIMGYINKRRVHYMAKATFFNSPLKRFFLNALGMIPINRKSDSAVKGVENKQSFEACYQLLEAGEILVIFPEGTSYLERKLRELKSGTARIALETESRNDGNLGLLVIPVGLNYISADSFRGSVLANVGRPIPIAEYLEEYRLNQGKAAKKLTEKFRTELSRVFVTMSDDAKATLVTQLGKLFDSRYSENAGVRSSINLMKDLQDKLDEIEVSQPWKIAGIEEKTNELIKELTFFQLKPDYMNRPYKAALFVRQTLLSYFFMLLCLPLFIIGFVHNILPYVLIGRIVPKVTPEAEYHAPVTVILGLLLYPLNYAAFCFAAGYFLHLSLPLLLAYFFSLPLFGLFAHFCMRYMKHLLSKQHFSHFANSRKTIFNELKQRRKELEGLIFD